jgi:hypothetical protein
MWQGIKSFLVALPELLKLVNRIGNAIDKAKKNNLWKDIEETLDATEKASTPQERVAAARRITNIISRIGS